jgi:hypothetical protein
LSCCAAAGGGVGCCWWGAKGKWVAGVSATSGVWDFERMGRGSVEVNNVWLLITLEIERERES